VHRRALTAPLLLLALLSGCTTTTAGTAAPDVFAVQEHTTCRAATDKAAGAIRAFLADADLARFDQAAAPDTAPIRAAAQACSFNRARALSELIVKVSDGFRPTTVYGQLGYQGVLTALCDVDGVPVSAMGARAQAVCAGR
jgi:hypothetical protein